MPVTPPVLHSCFTDYHFLSGHRFYRIQVMLMLGTFFAALYMDRRWMGRRKAMMMGSFGAGVSMMMIAILLSIGSKEASSAATAFFFTFNFSFAAVR
jgi:hypothetical protein